MFDFETEERASMRKTIRELARRELPRFQTERHYGTVPRELFTSLAKIGLTGLTIPEQYGGVGASPVDSMIAMEELAAVDLGPAIFTSVHLMVAGLINRFGNDEQRQRYLPRMAAGESLGAFALTEPSAGSDAAALKTEAAEHADGHSLRGEKCYITSAGFADLYIVFARTPAGGKDAITAFIVDGTAPGLAVASPEHKMGCELSPIASLNFDNLIVPSQQILGTLHRGFEIAMGGLTGGRINIASCGNGLSRAAIERATSHLKERKQFGQPLMDFQGLQFMLADMQMRFDAARLLTIQAALIFERDPAARENRKAAAEAKCFATDAAMQITTDAVQLLGGAGYIREYQVERLMREAKMLQIVEGTNQIQRMIIAREMAAKA